MVHLSHILFRKELNGLKILILSCDTGEGHNSAGKAIKEAAEHKGHSVTMIDMFLLSGKGTSHAVSGAYIGIVKHIPFFFGLLYKVGMLISSDKRKSPVYFANALLCKKLSAYIESNGFDAVVTPHLYPAEAPLLFLFGIFCSEVHMSKPFITYTAQVEKLKNEKNLVITDDDFAVESLQNISYYALIGGYKHPFIDIHTRKYINEACFEDIVALYEFDEELRGIFFKYLCRVERKMRSSISYHFCKKHGERQEEYLNSNNYGNIPKNKNGITKLIKMLDMMANKNKDHEYLVYQRNKYHNIPLWVIMNTLTFGQISKMFEFLPQNMQGAICQDFGNIKKNEMIKYLKVLTLYRNVCAHNERLFSYHTYIDIPDTLLHKKLGISKNGSKYIYGKNDLFSVVITFRYLLPKTDFLLFKKQLWHIFDRYQKQNLNLKLNDLFEYMGFPCNWKEITKFRKI
jgi:abortive infection bacteriophage resistance protein